jgi:hypothetical protein
VNSVDLRGNHNVTESNVALERPGNPNEEDNLGLEKRDGSFGRRRCTDVALSDFGDGYLPGRPSNDLTDLIVRSRGMRLSSRLGEERANRVVFEVECGKENRSRRNTGWRHDVMLRGPPHPAALDA